MPGVIGIPNSSAMSFCAKYTSLQMLLETYRDLSSTDGRLKPQGTDLLLEMN